MKFIIDSHIPYIHGVLEGSGHECCYVSPEKITPQVCKAADALVIRTRTLCDASLLGGSSIKAIATATIGYDHIDTDYCRQNGIAVFSAPGCNADAVCQWVFAALCAWSKIRGGDYHGMTLGIVGVGHVGSLVMRHAMQIGMKVLCCDPPLMRAQERAKRHHNLTPVSQPQDGFKPLTPASQPPAGDRFALLEDIDFVPLEYIARNADIVTLHTPLTLTGADTTYHLCGKDFLDTFSASGKLLLNAARGGVLDEQQALLHPETDYAIDCWEHEPRIGTEMLNAALIATPHIAGYSAQGKANATTMAVRQISRHFDLGLDQWTAPYTAPLQTAEYDIMADDKALRQAPQQFEFFRSNYKLRE